MNRIMSRGMGMYRPFLILFVEKWETVWVCLVDNTPQIDT